MEITTKQVPQLSSQTPAPPQDFEKCNGPQHSQVNSLPAWDQRTAGTFPMALYCWQRRSSWLQQASKTQISGKSMILEYPLGDSLTEKPETVTCLYFMNVNGLSRDSVGGQFVTVG